MSVAAHVSRHAAPGPARLLDLHAQWPHRYPVLLESAARSDRLGRYDLLLAYPQGCIARFSDDVLTAAGCARDFGLPGDTSFLDALDRLLSADSVAASGLYSAADYPPFTGGWFVYAAYEIAREIEPRLRLPRATQAALEGLALRVPAAIIYEHDTGRHRFVAESAHAPLIHAMQSDFDSCPPRGHAQPITGLVVREDPPEDFLAGVLRAQQFIRAGDVYQVNLSRGWHAEARQLPTAAELYAALRTANPAPFAASLVLGEHAILSSSPERLFAIRDGEINTRPIAGTRPRSRRPGADEPEKSALSAHPKERAEHVMLLDLERNDLGRVCAPGTVRVDEFMTLESYAHVHHIVSSVLGRLREGVTAAEILRAVFPGGTITGCPKIRCMEIIAELEGVPRGAYTGSLGYLNLDGSGDFNILIRTMVRTPWGLDLRAGAGIVADSIPERELEETRAKALGMLQALGQAS